jgi:hypothetical protein
MTRGATTQGYGRLVSCGPTNRHLSDVYVCKDGVAIERAKREFEDGIPEVIGTDGKLYKRAISRLAFASSEAYEHTSTMERTCRTAVQTPLLIEENISVRIRWFVLHYIS